MSRIRCLRAPPSNVHQTRTRPSQLLRTRSAPCKLRFARFGACTWAWVPGRYLHRGLMECIWPNKHRGTWIGRGEVLVPHSTMHAYGTLVTNDDRALAKIAVRVRIGYQNVGISHSLLGHGRVWGWREDWARCSRPRPGWAAAGIDAATCRSGGWSSTTRQREPYMVDPVSRFSGVHSCAARLLASLPTTQFLLLQ